MRLPELKEPFHGVLNSRDRLSDIRGRHKRAYTRGENDPSFAKEFSSELQKFDGAEKALKDHIARLAADVTKSK
jgi:hypothetical protein